MESTKFLLLVFFGSMKRTLSRYNKFLDSPEQPKIEFKAEVVFDSCFH